MKLKIPHIYLDNDVIFVLSNNSRRFENVISAYTYMNLDVYYIDGFKRFKSQGVTYISTNEDLINCINEA